MNGQDIRETYLEAGEYFASIVDQVDIDGWDRPALGECCIRDLAGHTYRSFTTVLSYSLKPAVKVDLQRPVDYIQEAQKTLIDPKHIAELGRAAGLEIIDDPRMMVRGFAMYVKNKLEELPDDFILARHFGGIQLIDYLPTRPFELIIHTMDLAKSVGVVSDPPEAGMEATIDIIGQMALSRGYASDLILSVTGRGQLPAGFSVLSE